jgi:hypothetical protein
MKRLFWKLDQNGNSFKLKTRNLPVLIFNFIKLPITVLTFILNFINDGINQLTRVRDAEITTTSDTVVTKELRKEIYTRLLN